MTTITVDIKRLPEADDLPLPAYQTAHAAGMDLCAAVTADVILTPGALATLPELQQAGFQYVT